MNISQNQLESIRQWVFSELENDSSGHDTYHIKRVVGLAKKISHKESCNSSLVELIALIHDMTDYKLFDDQDGAKNILNNKLAAIELNQKDIEFLLNEIEAIGFKGSGATTPTTIEAQIVQDADRLDAIGAIGIARAFAYGGKKGNLLYDPKNEKQNSLQHFDDKLLHLKKLMNTSTGKELAEERTIYLSDFKKKFLEEWGQ